VTAQALPKTQELEDKIDSLAAKRRKPSDFEICLLKTEAVKLKGKIPYPDYYALLGQIACLENNKDKMIAHYKEAITLSFNKNLEIKKNYCIGLGRCGLLFEVSEQLKEIKENFSTSSEILSILIHHNSDLCRFRNVLSLSKSSENKPAFFNTIEKAISIFENAELSDDEAQNLCALAYSVMETQNLYCSGWKIEIIDDCILYTIYVDKPIEEIFEVNWALANVFAENVENMRSDVLMFEYSSVDILEEKEKYERLI